jgi:hypothetical protein
MAVLKKILAAFYLVGGLLSMLIASTYLYYGAAGNNVFDPASQGVLPVIGIAIVVSMHALNASGCFSVAFSLWRSTRWGRLLVFVYDGLVFLIFSGLLVFPLFVPTNFRFGLSFVLFNLFVLLVCGATIAVSLRKSSPLGGEQNRTGNKKVSGTIV